MTRPEQESLDKEQSLLDHLAELRSCLIHAFAGIFICTAICFYFHEELLSFVRKPIEPFLKQTGGGLVFTSPIDKIVAAIKVSLLAGVILSTPFWVYQVWRFISPGLYRSEKRIGVFFLFTGSALFVLGCTFVYYLVFPLALEFLLNFGDGKDQALITIDKYIGFFFSTTLLFGLAFELPLVLSILAFLGLVDRDFLKEKRAYAYVTLAFVSAFLTPPDPLSMLILLVPLIFLYELSIFMVGFISTRAYSQTR